MSGKGDRLQYSGYAREGYKLDVGRLWEIDCGYSMRELDVFANANGIRIRDMGCGEWEMAERSAVWLSVDKARQLGEILLAAADEVESHADMWRLHTVQADPNPALDRLLREQRDRLDRELAAERADKEQLRDLREKLAGTEVTE